MNIDERTRYMLVVIHGTEGMFTRTGRLKYSYFSEAPITKVLGDVPRDFNLERLARAVYETVHNQQYDGLMEVNDKLAAYRKIGDANKVKRLEESRNEILAHMIGCTVYDHLLTYKEGHRPSDVVAEWCVQHTCDSLLPWEDGWRRYWLLTVTEIPVIADRDHFTSQDVYDFAAESYASHDVELK